MIDKSYLSDEQKAEIEHVCATWQNRSLCTQAAFCAEWTAGIGSQSGGSCHEIAQIAADDYKIVSEGLAQAGPCNRVQLEGGYTASHAEAERDLQETRAAFQVAVQGIDFYNGTNTCKARAASLVVAGGGGTAVALSVVGTGGALCYGWTGAVKYATTPASGVPGPGTVALAGASYAVQC